MNITYAKSVNDIKTYIGGFKTVYLFGAGMYAKIVLDSLEEMKNRISSVVVSSKKGNPKEFSNIPVMEIEAIGSDVTGACFVLGIPDKYVSDVINRLDSWGEKYYR